MPLSFPKGILYIPLDGVDAFSTNNKTGLPNAIGNMPNIPSMQNGPGPLSADPSGPYTSFFMDRKTGRGTLTLKLDVIGKSSLEIGNLPNIGSINGNYSGEPSGPFTSFYFDRKTGSTSLRIKTDVVGKNSLNIGNLPDIESLKSGGTSNSTGPFTTFYLDRKNGKPSLKIRNDVVGKKSQLSGNLPDPNLSKSSPVKLTTEDLSSGGNPTADSWVNKTDSKSLPRELKRKNSVDGYKILKLPSTPARIVADKFKIFNAFLDYSGKQFSHGLDYLEGGTNKLSYLSDSKLLTNLPPKLYEGSKAGDLNLRGFVTTRVENEDPTYLGYDIVIKTTTSPLFNGELKNFLNTYSEYCELSSRATAYDEFVLRIKRLINYDLAKYGEAVDTDRGRVSAAPINTYYLKKLSGLDNLVEKTQTEGARFFADYPKDKITLTFREDVSQQIGWLASLYKTLSWSRINGKQIIPENLLRFDCDIVVSEVRKFNRIFSGANGTSKSDDISNLTFMKDNISKYTYSLYECQFYFDGLPHGNELDMSEPKMVDDYSVDINYKFSTMKFEKFEFSPRRKVFDKRTLNNGLYDIGLGLYSVRNNRDSSRRILGTSEVGNLSVTGTQSRPDSTEKITVLDPSVSYESGSLDELNYANQPDVQESEGRQQLGVSAPFSDLNKELDNPSVRPSIGFAAPFSNIKNEITNPVIKPPLAKASPFMNLKNDLRRAFANEINRQISKQVGLLFKTIENLRRQIPFAGQLDEPTNVYSGRSQFENELINAGRNFVGASLRGLFGNPSIQGNLPRRRGGR